MRSPSARFDAEASYLLRSTPPTDAPAGYVTYSRSRGLRRSLWAQVLAASLPSLLDAEQLAEAAELAHRRTRPGGAGDVDVAAASLRQHHESVGRVAAQLASVIHQALPNVMSLADLEAAIAKRFDFLTCQGAAFHNDIAGDWKRALFWVFVLDAPATQLVLPNMGIKISLEPGQLIVFDPSNVHGVLRTGCRTFSAPGFRSKHRGNHQAFLCGELQLTQTQWLALGVRLIKPDEALCAAMVEADNCRIDTRTGRWTAQPPRED